MHRDPKHATHAVENQPPALFDYNAYLTDPPLREAVRREGGGWADGALLWFGAWAGSEQAIRSGFDANDHPPTLRTHDRWGRRVDEVRFHPAYDDLMSASMKAGLHGAPWEQPQPGANVARAAAYLMQVGVEPGHLCPITMTFASVPSIRHSAAIADEWIPKVLHREYDPRNVPHTDKQSVTIGMAMTEKQGGSDVRTNTTTAVGQPDGTFELTGHKWFVSAPMCDAFLVLAQSEGGLTCFLVPRWRPDGRKNDLEFQQLKRKMGNVSNASSEAELWGALGWQLGSQGRGVATIIEMVALTRFDVMLGSTGLMRQAVVQAIHHTRYRRAFGDSLIHQPLMQQVLADLAVEAETALVLSMRIARALDDSEDERERLLVRLGTAVGKYWISKRAPGHTYEAMECLGGAGAMEESVTARLYREAPINAIWEGSGNVQALDVLRSIHKEPKVIEAFFDEVRSTAGEHCLLDARIARIENAAAHPDPARARRLTEDLALTIAGSLLIRADSPAAEAFLSTRLSDEAGGHLYGSLPPSVDPVRIIARTFPA